MNAQAFPHKAASVEQHPGILHCCTLNVRRKLNSRARRAKNRPRALCDPRPASSTQTPVEENQATACPPLLASPIYLSSSSFCPWMVRVNVSKPCLRSGGSRQKAHRETWPLAPPLFFIFLIKD